MAEEQQVLFESLGGMARELIAPTAVAALPVESLHLGVVTTDMGTGGHIIQTCTNPTVGDDGVLQNVSGYDECQDAYSAADCDRDECPWITYSTEEPDDGSDPDNAPFWHDFGCIAVLGCSGCGFEQQLEASHRALVEQTAPGRPNEGFLRDDSLLVIVYVTDEDDCSTADSAMFDPERDDLGALNVRCNFQSERLYPISRYHDAFVALHGDRVVVAAIAGVPIDGSWEPGDPLEELRDLAHVDPSSPNELLHTCDTAMGVGFAPVRIAELVYSFGDDGVLASCCREDWTDAMSQIVSAIQRHLGVACVDLPYGVDPATDCRLVEVLGDGSERVVPYADDEPSGWSVAMDGEGCPGGQLQLDGLPLAAEGYRFECVTGESGDAG